MMSPFFDLIAHLHQRTLVDAGVLVRALVLHQPVDIDARLGRIGLVGRADDDTGRVDLIDDAGAARRDRGARVTRNHAFHAGADERRLGANERHRLALHVRAHQRAVGVVVLEERDERRGHRNELLRRHVHEVDLVARHEMHVAGLTADDQVFREACPWHRSAHSPARPRSGSLPSRRDRCTSSVTRPSLTLRYGVSTKPYLFTRA